MRVYNSDGTLFEIQRTLNYAIEIRSMFEAEDR